MRKLRFRRIWIPVWIPGRRVRALLVILALFGLALFALIPIDSVRLGRAGIRLGLDLNGGSHLVYQADLSMVENPDEAMLGALGIIQRRVDAYGVTEPVVQKQGSDRILIQLPGVQDIDEAKELIGATALLSFWELQSDTENGYIVWSSEIGLYYVEAGQGAYVWSPALASTEDDKTEWLTGTYLKANAKVVADQAGQPQVAFEFNEEGAKFFEEITTRNLYKPLGIFLDNNVISWPTVQAVLSDSGVITGLSLDAAKNLAIQLNAGALPVPLEPIFEDTISATLGADFINRSLLAGAIGLGLVILFMVLYYRLPGAIASLALLVYGALVLAIFKILPVTLTLTGIGGFILSVGMAVDANVLIMERIKEELRGGRTLGAAIETGFNRAWTAIRDSNISTFIICGILYWFASGIVESPAVMGFAVTLFIGVAVSMFTAIIVSRTFLRFFSGARFARRPTWFSVETKSMKLGEQE